MEVSHLTNVSWKIISSFPSSRQTGILPRGAHVEDAGRLSHCIWTLILTFRAHELWVEGEEVDICSAEPAAVALRSLILYRNEETDESMFRAVFHCGDGDRSCSLSRNILTIKYGWKRSLTTLWGGNFQVVRDESPASWQRSLWHLQPVGWCDCWSPWILLYHRLSGHN